MKRILLAVVLAIGCAMPQTSKASVPTAIFSGAIFAGAEYITQLMKLQGIAKAGALVVTFGALAANRLAAHHENKEKGSAGEESLVAMGTGVGLVALRYHLAQK